MTDDKLAVSQEARIITRAGKCGHHHDADCEACQSALDYNNKSLDDLRAELAQARLAGERAGMERGAEIASGIAQAFYHAKNDEAHDAAIDCAAAILKEAASITKGDFT